MKKVTITSKDISQKQWSNLVLEMNLIKKAWSSYAKLEIQGPGIKKIIAHGTRNFDVKMKRLDEAAIMWNKTKDPKYKDLWYKLIKDNYGTNNSKRRIVSINSVVKADDGTCVFIGHQ
jgi:hypothetical protein